MSSVRWDFTRNTGDEEWAITDGSDAFPLAAATAAEFAVALRDHDEQVRAETIRNLAEELSEPSILWLGRKSIPRDGLVEMLHARSVSTEQIARGDA